MNFSVEFPQRIKTSVKRELVSTELSPDSNDNSKREIEFLKKMLSEQKINEENFKTIIQTQKKENKRLLKIISNLRDEIEILSKKVGVPTNSDSLFSKNLNSFLKNDKEHIGFKPILMCETLSWASKINLNLRIPSLKIEINNDIGLNEILKPKLTRFEKKIENDSEHNITIEKIKFLSKGCLIVFYFIKIS